MARVVLIITWFPIRVTNLFSPVATTVQPIHLQFRFSSIHGTKLKSKQQLRKHLLAKTHHEKVQALFAKAWTSVYSYPQHYFMLCLGIVEEQP